MPDRRLEALQPGLVDCRQVGQVRDPALRRHRVSFDLAAPDVTNGVGRLIAHEINLPAEQVDHRRAHALVGNRCHRGVEHAHDQHAA